MGDYGSEARAEETVMVEEEEIVSSSRFFRSRFHRTIQSIAVLLGTGLILSVRGGGGGSTPGAGGGSGGGDGTDTTATQIKIGNAPADRVIAFEVTVGPISFTPSSGSAVTV